VNAKLEASIQHGTKSILLLSSSCFQNGFLSSSQKYFSPPAAVCFCHFFVTGSLFQHWTQEAQGEWDGTLCVTARTLLWGGSVCGLKNLATLWRRSVAKYHTLAKRTISQCKLATVSSLNEGWGESVLYH